MGLTPQLFPPLLTSSASAVAESSADSIRILLPRDTVPIPQENGHAPIVGQDSGSHIAKCRMRMLFHSGTLPAEGRQKASDPV
jgi:hypothetical protein